MSDAVDAIAIKARGHFSSSAARTAVTPIESADYRYLIQFADVTKTGRESQATKGRRHAGANAKSPAADATGGRYRRFTFLTAGQAPATRLRAFTFVMYRLILPRCKAIGTVEQVDKPQNILAGGQPGVIRVAAIAAERRLAGSLQAT